MVSSTRSTARCTSIEPQGEDFDVVIIGSGAGGGTLARALADSGHSILILERGGWLPREPQNWDPVEVFQNDRYVSKDLLGRQRWDILPTRKPLLRRWCFKNVWSCSLQAA